MLSLYRLLIMPLLSRYIGLSQYPAQQCNTDIGLMRIRNTNIDLTPRHKLVPSSRKRSFESKITKTINELLPRNRGQLPHAVRRALRSYLRAVGMNCCLRTLRSSHSSSTSCSSARHSFFVAPCAHTPWNPKIVPTYGRGSSIFSTFAFVMTALTYSVNMRLFYHTLS